MTKSLVSFKGRGGLAERVSAQEHVSEAFFLDLPSLVIDPANLPRSAKQLAIHLTSSRNLFERDSEVVRIVVTCEGARIERLNPHSVVIAAHEVCQPVQNKTARGEIVPEKITLPLGVAKLYLNLGENLGLPILTGICAAPLLAEDGDIKCSAGYDDTSRLWCVGVDRPQISDRPALKDAKEALLRLRRMFASFPFADSARADGKSVVDLTKDPGVDESSFLVGLMTALCRPSLPFAPALLISAPQLSGSGTGKGLLVHAIADIAFGRRPKAFTSRGDRQELTKRIETVLMTSEPMVFLDNCNAELLTSNALAQVITENSVNTRPLGQSKMMALSTSAFIVVTGNAVQISEDLARRFLIVDLDARCENPEQRKFDQSFAAIIKDHRLDLVAALLTIWRWGRQNRLDPGLPFGSFERWAS